MNHRSCTTLAYPLLLALQLQRAHCPLPATRGCNPKAAPVPVDTSPPARVAGPVPHFRKFSFLVGATAATLALVLVSQLIAMMS